MLAPHVDDPEPGGVATGKEVVLRPAGCVIFIVGAEVMDGDGDRDEDNEDGADDVEDVMEFADVDPEVAGEEEEAVA